jgi:hypothetical protein
MAVEYGSVTITTSATKVIDSNPARRGLILANNGSAVVYIGPNDQVTPSTGIPIAANGNLTDSGPRDLWKGVVYAIVASGTVDLRYMWWSE